jgi:hypothetical protein
LTTQGKEFQPAFSRIAMVENTEGEANEALASDALIPLQSAMGRVITKGESTWLSGDVEQQVG